MKKFIMNFVIRDVVYDLILMIIDRYIKKIDVVKLTKIFFEKIILRFNISKKIVNDTSFMFMNEF